MKSNKMDEEIIVENVEHALMDYRRKIRRLSPKVKLLLQEINQILISERVEDNCTMSNTGRVDLIQARKNSGLYQKDVAKAINIAQQTLSFYESGKRTPSFKIMKALSKLYNIPLFELFGKDD